MEPCYIIDEVTQRRILGTIDRCEELGIENLCFLYNPTIETKVIKFYLVRYADYWQLTVILKYAKRRDIYAIKGDSLIFDSSLQD